MLKGKHFPVLSPSGNLMMASVEEFSRHGKIYFGNRLSDEFYGITCSNNILYYNPKLDYIVASGGIYGLGSDVRRNCFWEGFNYEDF